MKFKLKTLFFNLKIELEVYKFYKAKWFHLWKLNFLCEINVNLNITSDKFIYLKFEFEFQQINVKKMTEHDFSWSFFERDRNFKFSPLLVHLPYLWWYQFSVLPVRLHFPTIMWSDWRHSVVSKFLFRVCLILVESFCNLVVVLTFRPQ